MRAKYWCVGILGDDIVYVVDNIVVCYLYSCCEVGLDYCSNNPTKDH